MKSWTVLPGLKIMLMVICCLLTKQCSDIFDMQVEYNCSIDIGMMSHSNILSLCLPTYKITLVLRMPSIFTENLDRLVMN